VIAPRRSDFAGRRFWQALVASAFTAIGAVAMPAGLFDVLFPDRLPRLGWPTALGVLALALGVGVGRAWPRSVEAQFASPNVTIRIVEGDLLDRQEHLVIGMNDTFDTAPGVIAATSVQAQFLDRIYGGDAARLDEDLEAALAGATHSRIGKEGKTKQHPVGTVASLGGPSRLFFCVAYSSMNDRNEARASIAGVTASLNELWKAVCQHANGGTVAMPVIGGGQSRLSQSLSPADAIRLQVLSFWLACREERFCEGLTVVMPREAYDRLDRREIQAFLTNLGPS
jgi:hypothetical protein